MPTRQVLESLQDLYLADDVAIPVEALHWSVEEAERFFESGGAERPDRDCAERPQDRDRAERPDRDCGDSSISHGVRRTRLLCLHGSASNAEATSFQLMILGLYDLDAKLSMCDCTFLEGPHVAPFAFDPQLQGEARSWHMPNRPLDAGLRRVVEHVNQHGPYDGAYGFSQGCCMLAMLSDPGVWLSFGGSELFPPWRFAIMGCGTDYLLASSEAPRIAAPLEVPSLHIIGKFDGIRHDSHSLARRFHTPLKLTHDGGHAMPISLQDGSTTSNQLLDAVAAFVRDHTTPPQQH
jgi:hypothetical protein